MEAIDQLTTKPIYEVEEVLSLPGLCVHKLVV